MGKLWSLVKASMTEGMSLFRVKLNTKSRAGKAGFVVILSALLLFIVYNYADMLLEKVAPSGAGYITLTVFGLLASIGMIVEGIYKAPALLFNCKDDDLMLSLPVKKSTVFFIRLLKFYLFEVLFGAIILVPTMVAYVVRIGAQPSFYVVGIAALLLLPIVPVMLSALVSIIISVLSAKSRHKNLIQTILTVALVLATMAFSMNIKDMIAFFAENATSISEIFMKIYYPVGVFTQLISDFNILTFIIFIIVNIVIAVIFIMLSSKFYFVINSKLKVVKSKTRQRALKVKKHSINFALVMKEMKKFTSSPVFLVNAGFSLVLYLIFVFALVFDFDSLASSINMTEAGISVEQMRLMAPAILAGLIVFCSFMSSITSSMISLEGKSINVLRAMPISSLRIIGAKVLMAALVAAPIFIIGDIVMFIYFPFDLLQMAMVIALSIVMPLVSALFGIIVNLKFPKMDAENDSQVVKQSMSSMVATMGGMVMAGMTVYLMFNFATSGLSITEIIGVVLVTYTVIVTGLIVYVRIRGVKEFDRIEA